jgi:hypothetical protein
MLVVLFTDCRVSPFGIGALPTIVAASHQLRAEAASAREKIRGLSACSPAGMPLDDGRLAAAYMEARRGSLLGQIDCSRKRSGNRGISAGSATDGNDHSAFPFTENIQILGKVFHESFLASGYSQGNWRRMWRCTQIQVFASIVLCGGAVIPSSSVPQLYATSRRNYRP